MDLKKLNERLAKITEEEYPQSFITFEKTMDWAAGYIEELYDKYQHERITTDEYIERSINMATRIIDSAHAAMGPLFGQQ